MKGTCDQIIAWSKFPLVDFTTKDFKKIDMMGKKSLSCTANKYLVVKSRVQEQSSDNYEPRSILLCFELQKCFVHND